MTRFRLCILVFLLAFAVTPVLTACAEAPQSDGGGRGANFSSSSD